MNKNTNHIDQLFKSTLEGHQVKAPAHIKGHVLKGISKSNFWTWAAAILATVGVSTLLVLFFIPTPKTLQLYNNRVETLQLVPEQEEITIKAQEILLDEELVYAPNQTIPTDHTQSNAKDISLDENVDKEVVISIPTPSKVNTKTKKINTSNTVHKVNVNKTGSTIQEPKNDLSQDDDLIKNKINTTDNHKGLTLTTDSIETISEIQPPQKEPLNKIVLTEESTSSNNVDQVKTVNNQPDTAITIHHLPFQSKPLVDTMISANKPEKVIDNPENALPAEIIIEDITSPKTNKFFISVIGGPSINNANYGKNELSTTLANAHVEKIGYFAQLKGVYSINSKLFTEVGLGFEQQSYNTSFKINTTTYNVNEKEEFDYFIYDTTNQFIIDTVYKTTYDTTTIKGVKSEFGKVQNQYAQIPLYFGYQFEKNKWLFHLKAGVQLNYLLNQKGTYYQNNEIKDFTQNNTVLKKLVFNYNLGMSAHYNIMQDLYLSGQLNYQIGVQNYYKSDYGTRSINSLSFGIGIGYRF